MAEKTFIAKESTSQEIKSAVAAVKGVVDNTLAILQQPEMKRYGYRVKKTESGPAARVEYLYDAVGMTPAAMDFTNGAFNYGSWGDVWFVRDNFPCMVKNDGTIDYKLDPNNYAKKAHPNTSGVVEDSDVANAAYAGNAMSAIPCVWYKRWTDDTYYYFVCCEGKYDDSFYADVHTDEDGNVKHYKLIAMFKGSLIDSKLRSLAGQRPQSNTTATAELAAARKNDPSNPDTEDSIWTIREWGVWSLLGDLLCLMGKSCSSQTVYGQGHSTGGSSAASLTTTGNIDNSDTTTVENVTTNNLGMITKGQFFGYNVTTKSMKVFHSENWYADRWDRCVGLVAVDGIIKAKMNSFGGNYNLTGDGYDIVGDIVATTGWTLTSANNDPYYEGYQKKVLSNRFGNFPIEGGGSETTYETDYFWIRKNGTRVALLGGLCSYGGWCGSRYVHLNRTAAITHWHFGASLSLKNPV